MARHSLRDWLIVAEAVAWLAVARLVLLAIRFPRLARRLSRPLPARARADAAATARHVGWAVRTAARRGPIPAVCFPQALAARAMLHRRGIPATLFYGVQNGAEGLKAHVWVRAADTDVVGMETAAQHQLVATFPETPVSRG